MLTRQGYSLSSIAAIAGIACGIVAQAASGQMIIDEWASVTPPPPPALKSVTVDPKTTALLMLDFNQQTCNPTRKPRCISQIPKVKKLLTAARAAGVPVIYSITIDAKPSEIAAELAPNAGDPVVQSGVDKFINTDLEKILKDKGIATVVVVGTAAEGAVIYTASTAASRGMKVIVPLDGVSGSIPYSEQYLAWHLVNVPRLAANMTITRIDDVKF